MTLLAKCTNCHAPVNISGFGDTPFLSENGTKRFFCSWICVTTLQVNRVAESSVPVQGSDTDGARRSPPLRAT